jgi:2-dehydro-3-deoxygluconokinase
VSGHLVTSGEAMAVLTSPITGPLRHTPNEASAAIGVNRLGWRR